MYQVLCKKCEFNNKNKGRRVSISCYAGIHYQLYCYSYSSQLVPQGTNSEVARDSSWEKVLWEEVFFWDVPPHLCYGTAQMSSFSLYLNLWLRYFGIIAHFSLPNQIQFLPLMPSNSSISISSIYRPGFSLTQTILQW